MSAAICVLIHVGADDGKARTSLQKQQVGKAVVHLMVAQGRHIRGEQIHDLDRGNPLIFAVDQGPAEHVARDGVNDVLFLTADLVDVARQAGDTPDELLVYLLGQKVTVEVIGV